MKYRADIITKTEPEEGEDMMHQAEEFRLGMRIEKDS